MFGRHNLDLEKQFTFLRFVRINRGPLFLEDSHSELQEAVTQLLVKELGGWKKGRLLLIKKCENKWDSEIYNFMI